MRNNFKFFLYFAIVACMWVWDTVQDSAKAWIPKLSPHTALIFLWNEWRAVLTTAAGSIAAFLAGILAGWLLGMIAATGIVAARLSNDRLPGALGSFANAIDRAYTAVYVIPFVLTVALGQVILGKLDSFARGFIIILGAGMALGGYQVFLTLLNAVKDAPETSRDLVNSIFHQNRGRISSKSKSINLFVRAWCSAQRLRDCNIHAYCETLERAWHLSIVAVMIVESLIGSFYECFLPSTGTVDSWKRGIGGLVIGHTDIYSFNTIAGAVWVVVLLDLIGLQLIRCFCNHQWLKHYETT